ncbi:MAG TPA: hypothetical protein VE988_23395, partial [Gemmataceae bacterium]|nr:hypothetical protein [Gemmataceae bacterium]
MSAPKVSCPGCHSALNIGQALPANLRCPLCQVRFSAAADGQTTLNLESSTTIGSNNRAVALAAVFGGSALFLLSGLALLIYCLLPSSGTPPVAGDDNDDPPAIAGPIGPPKNVTLEPVAFIKKNPRGGFQDPGGAAKELPAGDAPVGVAKDASSPKPVEPVVRSNQKQIDMAIDKGVAYLKSGLDHQGQFRSPGVANADYGSRFDRLLGNVALIGLTLLSCGEVASDLKIAGIAGRMRREAPNCTQTYEISCCIWFLDKLGDPQDRGLIRQLALRLIASQHVRGGWDYGCSTLTAAQDIELLRLLESSGLTPMPVVGITPPAKAKQPAKKGQPSPPPKQPTDFKMLPVMQWHPGRPLPTANSGHEDNSLTQFAILALWASQKYGVPAQRSLAMAEANFRQTQSSAGTWKYDETRPTTRHDSMTCAGLVGLAVGRGLAQNKSQGQDFGKDPQVEKALLYLGARMKAKGALSAPPVKGMGKTQGKTILADAWGDYYFLWSVERVGVLLKLETIGGHDWYDWGSRIIVANQEKDGSWSDAFKGPVDT